MGSRCMRPIARSRSHYERRLKCPTRSEYRLGRLSERADAVSEEVSRFAEVSRRKVQAKEAAALVPKALLKERHATASEISITINLS